MRYLLPPQVGQEPGEAISKLRFLSATMMFRNYAKLRSTLVLHYHASRHLPRQFAFAVLLLAAGVLEYDDRIITAVFLPVCLLNVVFPAGTRWKQGILIALYVPALAWLWICLFLKGNVYYCALVLGYLVAAYGWRKDVPTAALLFVTGWLWALSLGHAYLPLPYLLDVVFVTLIGLVLGFFATKRLRAMQAADPLALVVCFSFLLMEGWYFLPAFYPSFTVDGQPGVRVVAAFDRDREFRDLLGFSQLHFVDQYNRDTLLVGTKHHLTTFGKPPRNVYMNIEFPPRYEATPITFFANRLLMCPDGTYPNLRFYSLGQGYCLSVAGKQLLFGGDCNNLLLIDLEKKRELQHERSAALDESVSIYKTTVYGDNRFLRSIGGRLLAGNLNAAGTGVDWHDSGRRIFPLFINDSLVGTVGAPDVYLFRMLGTVARLDPDTGESVRSTHLAPGVRFLTIDAAHDCLFVVNEWLGLVYVLDPQSLRVRKRIFVGHLARRVNISHFAPDKAYVASRVGIVELDLAALRF